MHDDVAIPASDQPHEPVNLEHEYVVSLVARALRKHLREHPSIETLRDMEIAIEYDAVSGYEVFIEKRGGE